MKAFLQALIFLLPVTTGAQNWALFNSYDRYDFKQNSAPLINSVCFADSFGVSGSDTLYFVNRIVERNNLNNTNGSDTAQLNRWQFLQREIWRRANGWYVFFNPGSLTINAYAGLGEQWLYDTVRNISATVIKADTASLFGIVDSVKYFALSDGSDTIIVSRSFGVLRFPADTSDRLQPYTGSFYLQGIETRNVGASAINFSDIYNFNVGDVFVYTATFYGGPPIFYKDKYTILSKNSNADSISYMARDVSWSQTMPASGPPLVGADTVRLTFKDSATHLANAYPSQLLNYIINYNGFLYTPFSGFEGTRYHTLTSYIIDNTYGVSCKQAGGSMLDVYDSIQNNQMIGQEGFPGGFYCIICQGLGHVHYGISEFENFYGSVDLTGYEKNGVTYGTVPTDEEMGWTGISEISQGPLLRVYPNVVKDILLVSLSNTQNTTYHFNLYDLTGRLLISYSLPVGNTNVLCSNLSPAMYVWKACDNNGNVLCSGKIIKQ